MKTQCLGKGLEKALANKGDIAGMEQAMMRESGMANALRMKMASKVVVGQSSVAELGSVKNLRVCRRGFWDLLPGWERQGAHRPGMVFCIESSLSAATG